MSDEITQSVVPQNDRRQGKALTRRCRDVGQAWRRKLAVCRSPSADSNDIASLNCETCICTSFRRASSTEESAQTRIEMSVSAAVSLPHSKVKATKSSPTQHKICSMVANETSKPSSSSMLLDAEQIFQHSGYSPTLLNNHSAANATSSQLSSSHPSSSRSRSSPMLPPCRQHKVSAKNSAPCSSGPSGSAAVVRRTAPLFPCFNPRHSSDSEDREEGVSSSVQRTQCAVKSDMRSPTVPSSLGNSGSVALHQFHAVGGMIAEPYPVHTQVEYTHCLVPDMVSIMNSSYYWGVMDRFQAEKLLDNKPEGTFLLRDSSQTEYLFSVSFRRYGRSLHARIEQLNSRFSFDSYDPGVFSSESVTGLIDHYKNPAVCLFFEPQLSLPLRRNFVFPLQHLCRAVITSKLKRYDAIQQLNLPKSLKNFLEEYHYKLPVRVRKVEH